MNYAMVPEAPEEDVFSFHTATGLRKNLTEAFDKQVVHEKEESKSKTSISTSVSVSSTTSTTCDHTSPIRRRWIFESRRAIASSRSI